MEEIWLATQRDPQNDWNATPKRVNYDVFVQAPLAKRHNVHSIQHPKPREALLYVLAGHPRVLSTE